MHAEGPRQRQKRLYHQRRAIFQFGIGQLLFENPRRTHRKRRFHSDNLFARLGASDHPLALPDGALRRSRA